MTRRHIFLYAAFAVVLAAVFSFVFALYTETGTSFVVRVIQNTSPRTLTYKSLTGRLGYRIHIDGLKMNAAGNMVTAESVDEMASRLYCFRKTGRR